MKRAFDTIVDESDRKAPEQPEQAAPQEKVVKAEAAVVCTVSHEETIREAVLRSDKKMVGDLLDSGFSIYGPVGKTSLVSYAFSIGAVDIVDYILERGAPPDAVVHGDFYAPPLFVKNGPTVQAVRSKIVVSLLYAACVHGGVEMTKVILKHMSRMSQGMILQGVAAVHQVVWMMRPDLLKLLLEAGACADAVFRNRMPLEYLMSLAQPSASSEAVLAPVQMIELLAAHGARLGNAFNVACNNFTNTCPAQHHQALQAVWALTRCFKVDLNCHSAGHGIRVSDGDSYGTALTRATASNSRLLVNFIINHPQFDILQHPTALINIAAIGLLKETQHVLRLIFDPADPADPTDPTDKVIEYPEDFAAAQALAAVLPVRMANWLRPAHTHIYMSNPIERHANYSLNTAFHAAFNNKHYEVAALLADYGAVLPPLPIPDGFSKAQIAFYKTQIDPARQFCTETDTIFNQ